MYHKKDLSDYWNIKFLEKLEAEKKLTSNDKKQVEKYGLPLLKEIPIRVLISEIQRLKKQGMSEDNTPEEQYDSYVNDYLSDADYQTYFSQKFPEVQRLSTVAVEDILSLISDISSGIEKSKPKIKQTFFKGIDFETIADIDLSIADPHNHGKRAAKIVLDNGVVLYYKPHGIKKNILYQRVYNVFCKQINLAEQHIAYLDCGQYGLEEAVQPKAYTTEAEVKRYFIRMGIHLFLAYILSASDLHGENIIAVGEYPVIADFEAFPGFVSAFSGEDADQSTSQYIGDSVLRSGILSNLTWGNGGKPAIVSALGTNKKKMTPFRLPVIKNDGTSDICIAHEPIELEIPECVVHLNQKIVQRPFPPQRRKSLIKMAF